MSDDEGEGEGEERNCKVVLLGESGVGKTSIISRFINDTFEEGLVTTTGASYAGKDMVFKDFNIFALVSGKNGCSKIPPILTLSNKL